MVPSSRPLRRGGLATHRLASASVSVLLLLGCTSFVRGQISSVVTGNAPPPLAYSGYGVLQVSWNYPSGSASSFQVTVGPLNEIESFDSALPVDGTCPWLWDYGLDASSTYAIAGGNLVMTVNGAADATTTRGNAAYMYRKMPIGLYAVFWGVGVGGRGAGKS